MVHKALVFTGIFLFSLTKCERLRERRWYQRIVDTENESPERHPSEIGRRLLQSDEANTEEIRTPKFYLRFKETVPTNGRKSRKRRVPSNCLENEVYFRGSCEKLLARGPCEDDQWVILSEENGLPKCSTRLRECDTTKSELTEKCAKAVLREKKETDPAFKDFVCEPSKGKTLAFTPSGSITCDCKQGYVLWKDGSCYEPFKQGPCKNGEFLDIRRTKEEEKSEEYDEEYDEDYGIGLRDIRPAGRQENSFFSISEWKKRLSGSASKESSEPDIDIQDSENDEALFEVNCAINPCRKDQFPIDKKQVAEIEYSKPIDEDDAIIFVDTYGRTNSNSVCAELDTASICKDTYVLDLNLETFELKCLKGNLVTRYFGSSPKIQQCVIGRKRVAGSCRNVVSVRGGCFYCG